MTSAAPTRLSRRGRWTLAGIGVGVVGLIVVANAHLVHVAQMSQPACVPHLSTVGDGSTTLRAARSSC